MPKSTVFLYFQREGGAFLLSSELKNRRLSGMAAEKQDQEMDVQRQFDVPFTMVQNSVIDCMGFGKPIDKTVYISLLRFAFNKGSAYPSITKLAYMNGVSSNTIRGSIKRLTEMNLVKKQERKKKNSENETNVYYIYDLSDKLKNDSVMNEDVYLAKVREDRKQKKEKKEGVQKLKGGTSKIEGGTSKTEGKEDKPFNNKNINKKLSSKESIYLSKVEELNELETPTKVKQVIKQNMDRLIDDSVSLLDIELFYTSATNDLSDNDFCIVLNNVLSKTKGEIKSIGNLLTSAIESYYIYVIHPRSVASDADQPSRTIPDDHWINS